MKRLPLAVLIVVSVLAGCAGRVLPTLDTYRQVPKTDKIDKFFFIMVNDDGASGCKVDVQPKDNGGADYVKVEKNWRVAWFVLNTCPAAKGEVPAIEFALKSDPTKKKRPIDFSVVLADVLIGKVKKVGNCRDTTTEAPCTTFKYTVSFASGRYSEDPDIEIVVY